MKLEGKTAIVTGTSPNIGGGIAEGLSAEGANLVCVDISEENAMDCARYLESQGARAFGVAADVTDEKGVQGVVERAVAEFGSVDVLVNNAVIFNQKGVLDMPLDEWRAQVSVILTGSFLFTQKVARQMVADGTTGTIINIISTAGHQGQPGTVGYCTGKSGLINFTRSVAMELAQHGIRVVSLTPTATDPTERRERAARWGREVTGPDPAPFMDRFRKGVPMQKLPSPSDYAKAAVFLASDDASMMTGSDLKVDAGAVSRYW
ncbi:MAG: SDR family NAD(P)-dependent oxidoreductase, partial [Gammaproteobacteria bacterium]|nr:SDR family NAD(P)-dependent oxidoreductase [Gammaproteobacteria bacterium]